MKVSGNNDLYCLIFVNIIRLSRPSISDPSLENIDVSKSLLICGLSGLVCPCFIFCNSKLLSRLKLDGCGDDDDNEPFLIFSNSLLLSKLNDGFLLTVF